MPDLVPTAEMDQIHLWVPTPSPEWGPRDVGSHTAPWAWPNPTQLSSTSPGPMPPQMRGENTGIIRTGQGPSKRWVHVVLGARPPPAGRASIQKLSGTCKRSEKGFTPESSREGQCRKPVREADVDKQPVWSVTESMGSRSLSRMRSIQKARVGLGSAGEETASGATVGRGGSGPPTGCLAGARDWHTGASYFPHQGTGH